MSLGDETIGATVVTLEQSMVNLHKSMASMNHTLERFARQNGHYDVADTLRQARQADLRWRQACHDESLRIYEHAKVNINETFDNESHIAKLNESVMKSELCDSTTCEVECLDFESMSGQDNMSVVDGRTCEDVSTNLIISTSSAVSCVVQVAFEERDPSVV